ncbi:MAG TPA: YdcF family protein [Burkholderiales bacterium]|nr:YdcF family protein [Burkholderiales bacterium]
MATWLITNTLAAFLLPPGCLLLVTLAGLLLMGRRKALGIALVAVSWTALYVLSMPVVAAALLRSLEEPYTDPATITSGDAIVVLGGGKYYEAPEYGNRDTANQELLVRLRYGAHLYRALGKPVLVTGGSPRGDAVAEGQVMKQVLEQDFNVPVRWVESESRTTAENATLSYALVQGSGVKSVYLVTHAWHMARARASFERAGFTIIPAPTLFKREGPRTIVDFLPNAASLQDSSIYFHETIGMAWYRFKSLLSSWS